MESEEDINEESDLGSEESKINENKFLKIEKI